MKEKKIVAGQLPRSAIIRWGETFEMIRTYSLAAATLALSLFSAKAEATLIGDEVGCSFSGTTYVCDSPTATVGAGSEFLIELSAGGDRWLVDIGDSFIELTLAVSGTLNTIGGTLTLDDLDWVGMPSGEIVDVLFSTANTTGIDASDVSFDAHSVSLALEGFWDFGAFVRLDLVTTHAQVPEPATLFSLAAGLIGLGGISRLRRRKETAAACTSER